PHRDGEGNRAVCRAKGRARRAPGSSRRRGGPHGRALAAREPFPERRWRWRRPRPATASARPPSTCLVPLNVAASFPTCRFLLVEQAALPALCPGHRLAACATKGHRLAACATKSTPRQVGKLAATEERLRRFPRFSH